MELEYFIPKGKLVGSNECSGRLKKAARCAITVHGAPELLIVD